MNLNLAMENRGYYLRFGYLSSESLNCKFELKTHTRDFRTKLGALL